jgi:hypothetical protein
MTIIITNTVSPPLAGRPGDIVPIAQGAVETPIMVAVTR